MLPGAERVPLVVNSQVLTRQRSVRGASVLVTPMGPGFGQNSPSSCESAPFALPPASSYSASFCHPNFGQQLTNTVNITFSLHLHSTPPICTDFGAGSFLAAVFTDRSGCQPQQLYVFAAREGSHHSLRSINDCFALVKDYRPMPRLLRRSRSLAFSCSSANAVSTRAF
jgi:hypothetical protein